MISPDNCLVLDHFHKLHNPNATLQAHTIEKKVYQNRFAVLRSFCNNSDSEMCRAHAKFWNSVTVQDKSTEDVHAPKNFQYVGLS